MAITFYYYSDYPDTQIDYSGSIESYTSASDGLVTIRSSSSFSLGTFSVGDVAKLYDSTDSSVFIYCRLVGAVAVIGGGWDIQISYDHNIYNADLDDVSSFIVYSKDNASYISVKAGAAETYKIGVQLETAAYSEQYIRYKVTERYDITIDTKRRQLMGYFFDVARAANAFIIDDCNNSYGVAYKVFMQGESFEAFNNKFRKEVKFRIIA